MTMAPERQLGFLWGAVAVALVALSPLAPRFARAAPACPVKTFAGIPCPGCGTTRAALALADLDLAAAFAVSPLAAAAWCGLILGGFAAGALAFSGRGVPALPKPTAAGDWAFRIAVVGAVAANWVYLVLHGT
jgi:hypothetical protein